MRTVRLFLALLLGAGALPFVAAAQDSTSVQLPTGRWSGSISPSDADPYSITVAVSYKANKLIMSMDTDVHGVFKLDNIVPSQNQLTFTYSAGGPRKCTLALRSDGRYVGRCSSSDGQTAEMILIPPKEKKT